MPLVLYPDINKEHSLPVYVKGIGVSCPQVSLAAAAENSHRLIVTVGGSGTVTVGDRKYDIPAGCGIFINKKIGYSCSDGGKTRKHAALDEWLVDMICFEFSTEMFEKSLFTAQDTVFFIFRDPGAVSAALRTIRNDLMSDPEYGAFSASAELYTLLVNLNHETLDALQLTHKVNPVIKAVVRYIDKKFTEDITLGDLCDAAGGISEQYLCRLFKQHTGERPIEFILHKRIGMARSYLEKTDMPISDIVKLTGFNNTSYFYRNFKKFVGISPLMCRQNSLKNVSDSDLS